MFFSFDGVDGAGKSTQMALFCQWLEQRGRPAVTCRDPGGTELGEEVRRILLDSTATRIDRRSEMFLYMAARAQMVEEIIAPALASGKTVVSDRYLLANVVYQGRAGGLDPDVIWRIGEFATQGVSPDLTIVLDLPDEAAAARMGRPLDRMEKQGDEFRRKLRAGFLAEAVRHPEAIAVIDANRSIDEVQATIRAAAQRLLNIGSGT